MKSKKTYKYDSLAKVIVVRDKEQLYFLVKDTLGMRKIEHFIPYNTIDFWIDLAFRGVTEAIQPGIVGSSISGAIKGINVDYDDLTYAHRIVIKKKILKNSVETFIQGAAGALPAIEQEQYIYDFFSEHKTGNRETEVYKQLAKAGVGMATSMLNSGFDFILHKSLVFKLLKRFPNLTKEEIEKLVSRVILFKYKSIEDFKSYLLGITFGTLFTNDRILDNLLK